MTDDQIIAALYRDTPPTLPRPPAGMPMADFWQSTEAGPWLLFLVVNVASKLRPRLVGAAIGCAKLALETARAKRSDALGDGALLAAQAVDMAESWLRGAASVRQVNQFAMAALACARSGPRPDLPLELADAAGWACITARNAGYADDDEKHGRPDRSDVVAVDAFAAQGAAVHALVTAGMLRDEAWQRTIEIVRAEVPWSVVR